MKSEQMRNSMLHGKYGTAGGLALWVMLCICLAASVLTGALAETAADSATITDETKEVSLNLSWGALSFAYADEYGLWDPEAHAYSNMVPSAWTATGNWIKLENVGSNTVKATFSVELNVDTVQHRLRVDGTEYEAVTLELDNGDSSTLELELSGSISEDYSTLGTINIEIIAK